METAGNFVRVLYFKVGVRMVTRTTLNFSYEILTVNAFFKKWDWSRKIFFIVIQNLDPLV